MNYNSKLCFLTRWMKSRILCFLFFTTFFPTTRPLPLTVDEKVFHSKNSHFDSILFHDVYIFLLCFTIVCFTILVCSEVRFSGVRCDKMTNVWISALSCFHIIKHDRLRSSIFVVKMFHLPFIPNFSFSSIYSDWLPPAPK